MFVEIRNKVVHHLTAMFGFIVNEPIYKTLHRLKMVGVVVMVCLYNWADLLMLEILALDTKVITYEMVGLYFTNFLLLVGIFVQTFKYLITHHE